MSNFQYVELGVGEDRVNSDLVLIEKDDGYRLYVACNPSIPTGGVEVEVTFRLRSNEHGVFPLILYACPFRIKCKRVELTQLPPVSQGDIKLT